MAAAYGPNPSDRSIANLWSQEAVNEGSRSAARSTSSSIEDLLQLIESESSLPLSRCVALLELDTKTGIELVNTYLDLLRETEALPAGTPHKLHAVATEVRDAIIRRAADSPASAEELARLANEQELSQLARDINRTQPESRPARALDANIVNALIQPSVPEAPIRVLHASLEYTKAKVAGVGSVTEALLAAQNETGTSACIVTPYYECYKADPEIAAAKFVGYVEHEYADAGLESPLNGGTRLVKSAIYKIKTQRGTVTQYLVKPDPRFSSLFDLESPLHIYKDVPHSKKWDRNFYLTSAIAGMCGESDGRSGVKAFDILHIHSWALGLAGRLIKEKYNPERESSGLAPMRVVQHFHGDTIGNEGKKCGCNHARIGLKPPSEQYPATADDDSFKDMQVQRDAWLFGTDAWIHVSDYYARLATETTTNLHAQSRNMQERGGLTSVLNGINHDSYDVTSPRTYKEFAIDPSSAETETPFLDGKERAKTALFDANVIPDAQKPLFMYVGRYADDKGIDVLPAMAEQAIREGGQVVIMGTVLDKRLPSSLKKLLRMQKKYPNSLRVYTDINEQRANCGNTNISKGLLIRQAADFSLIPSKREPCGLVGLESLAAGSIVISSKIEGLSDFLIDSPRDDFNAFTYKHGPAKGWITLLSLIKELLWKFPRNRNAKQAIRSAAAYHRSASRTQREQTARRIWQSSSAHDWKAPNGAVEKIANVYQRVMNGEVRPLNETDLKRIVTKTPRWRRMLNSVRRLIIRNLAKCHQG